MLGFIRYGGVPFASQNILYWSIYSNFQLLHRWWRSGPKTEKKCSKRAHLATMKADAPAYIKDLPRVSGLTLENSPMTWNIRLKAISRCVYSDFQLSHTQLTSERETMAEESTHGE